MQEFEAEEKLELPEKQNSRLNDVRDILAEIRCGVLAFLHGLKDACRLDVLQTIWTNKKLRSLCATCVLFNGLLFAVTWIIYNYTLYPVLQWARSPFAYTHNEGVTPSLFIVIIDWMIGKLHIVLWRLPVNILCLYFNSQWYLSIVTLVNKPTAAPGKTPAPTNDPKLYIQHTAVSIYMFVFYTSFTLVALLFGLVPFLGLVVKGIFFCWLFSLWCFQYRWSVNFPAQEPLRRMKSLFIYFEYHWIYFIGFGLPLTTAFFLPGLLKWGLSSLLFPMVVAAASQASPTRVPRRYARVLPQRLLIFEQAQQINNVVTGLFHIKKSDLVASLQE
mmetsp:Transcript_21507/g.24005  ORF Transcript_21507/g.24005 Transcript_21507/m.24005 type:complete len:331 (+) Transcript_21507:38-1030(+)